MVLGPDDGLMSVDRIFKNLASLGLREVEIEIFRHLLRGRRSVPELVELIFSTDRGSEHFHSQYMKLWRAIREMEARGLVSAPILGRDKSYHLTRHGYAVLGSMGQLDSSGVLSRTDLLLFSLTVLIGLLALVRPVDFLVFSFFSLLGATSYRILMGLGSVW